MLFSHCFLINDVTTPLQVSLKVEWGGDRTFHCRLASTQVLQYQLSLSSGVTLSLLKVQPPTTFILPSVLLSTT